jgi:hypothetical protein
MPINAMELAWRELDWSAEVDTPRFKLSLNKKKSQ